MINSTPGYDPVAKTLHWLIGLAILGMIGLGWYMENVGEHDPDRMQLFQLHKSIGITILVLALLRLIWRVTHKPPETPDGISRWERVAAKSVIVLFYILMIGVPFLGWMIVSASPHHIPTILYGLVTWPPLPVLPTLDTDTAKELTEELGDIHGFLAYTILGVVLLHVAAAVHHHFIKRNHILLGMLPTGLHGLFNRMRKTP